MCVRVTEGGLERGRKRGKREGVLLHLVPMLLVVGVGSSGLYMLMRVRGGGVENGVGLRAWGTPVVVVLFLSCGCIARRTTCVVLRVGQGGGLAG